MCLGFLGTRDARAADPIRVPLTSDRWQIVASTVPGSKPDVQFGRQEGFPQGLLVLKSGSVALNGLDFRNGTIEFDIKGIGENIPGIQFRKQGTAGAQNGEEFYIRTSPDCRASNDCIQYAPVINGFMLWNSYPQYQTQAFILDGWNHIKLVVSGRRMNVYINHVPSPTLVVGSLESNSVEGGIEFRGPAMFANLTVIPDAVEGLSPEATPDPTANDEGIVRQWQVGPLAPLPEGSSPSYAEVPDASSGWTPVTAGRFGMVNLNRKFVFTMQPPSLSWLRSTVTSDRNQKKQASFGWVGQVWVFVNGKLITDAKNLYDKEQERRDPDGRLALENGSFVLPLERGKNEVIIALYPTIHDDRKTPNRYAWGLEMRFDDPTGLRLSE
jgi:hypothetical protein